MKTMIFFLTLLLFSCSKDDDDKVDNSNPGILGTWKMTEQLLDPGDGSGTFQPVESSKTLTFYANNTMASNGEICSASAAAEHSTYGVYSVQDSSITANACSTNSWGIHFEINGGSLILNYPCIEPCKAKFEKLNKTILPE
jgi:hypothetical protein